MTYPFYTGNGHRPHPEDAPQLPGSPQARLQDPSNYLADPGLVDACNVALLLDQPLLLTGEPGTGKTEFARSLAWELCLDEPLKFETKSSSQAKELFYTYDALKRFEAIQTQADSGDVLSYIHYGPLGTAILRSQSPEDIKDLIPAGFKHPNKTRSVVLIDEVDKAPRDFSNDILNELERLYFRIPELNNRLVEADRDLPPIVILTSNSEKDLPDAFLRRCVYYDIPFPDGDRLDAIVANRLGLRSAHTSPFLQQALEIFSRLRAPSAGLRKPPATAELLGWLLSLQDIAKDRENPLAEPTLALKTLSILIKTAEDQTRAPQLVEEWISEQRSTSV